MKKDVKPRSYLLSRILKALIIISTVITLLVLLFVIGYVLIKGVIHIKPSLFSWNYTSENVSLLPSLINTLLMTVIALALSAPVGIFAAIYLTEYAKSGNKFVEIIRLAAETLSGIPSIVYGLFGMLFFVIQLGWGMSLLSGSFTVAIMVLPLIMRTTEEALMAVPDIYREGSYGLGAGKVRTVFTVILPAAVPGITSGIILAIGRIVGETAALIFTAGTVAKLPENFFSSTRTLSVHMYTLASEGLHIDEAYATAVVLLIFVILINALAEAVARRISKGRT